MSFTKKVLLSICFFAILTISKAALVQPRARCLGGSGIIADDCGSALSQFRLDQGGYVQYNTQGEQRDFGTCRILLKKSVAVSNSGKIAPNDLVQFVSNGLAACNGGTATFEVQDLTVNVIKI
ncbi:hypothetical protein BY996DRAFT_6423743 [Phakopsora pachyrhizi]|nr:hypothetical protein BY996DRAFT_6423743 [Phakopsora pachyrhizi]